MVQYTLAQRVMLSGTYNIAWSRVVETKSSGIYITLRRPPLPSSPTASTLSPNTLLHSQKSKNPPSHITVLVKQKYSLYIFSIPKKKNAALPNPIRSILLFPHIGGPVHSWVHTAEKPVHGQNQAHPTQSKFDVLPIRGSRLPEDNPQKCDRACL